MMNHNRLPLNGCMVRFINVDEHGVTADGERFDVLPKVYRGHRTIEDVVIRYPCGRLQLAERVIPARQAV